MVTNFSIGGGGGDTYTKQEIDNKVENLEIEISSKVATEDFNQFATAQSTIDESQNTAIESLQTEVDSLPTKEYVESLVSPRTPNVVKFGDLEIEDGVMRNFTVQNYAQFPFLMDLSNKAFEISMEITTSDDTTTQQNILDSEDGLAFAIRDNHFVLAVSSNGSSWAFEAEGGDLNKNTTFLVKVSWNRLVYKVVYSIDNGEQWVEAISQAYGYHPYPRTMLIGKDITNRYIYKGTINLNKCTLSVNNQYIWDGMTDAGLLTRLETDLGNIDANGVEYINSLIDNKIGYIDEALALVLGDE